MLETPLGRIEIFIDNKRVEYSYTSIDLDKRCLELDGRYLISLQLKPDGVTHELSCRIKEYIPSENDGIESGERLELKSFYKGSVKLSIGMEGDCGYYSNGDRASDVYDYDNEYYNEGVSYIILKETKTQDYKFGIAWLENYNDANEVETWYGADTTLMGF